MVRPPRRPIALRRLARLVEVVPVLLFIPPAEAVEDGHHSLNDDTIRERTRERARSTDVSATTWFRQPSIRNCWRLTQSG
jgi:hypothetical protein